MSQKLEPKNTPVSVGDLTPDWLSERRAIVLRDGHAVRAGAWSLTIEIQCINEPDRWLYLGRDGTPLVFATVADRDHVLDVLWGKVKLE